MKKLIFILLFFPSILFAEWKYNPYTQELDYYKDNTQSFYYFESTHQSYLYFDGVGTVYMYIWGVEVDRWTARNYYFFEGEPSYFEGERLYE